MTQLNLHNHFTSPASDNNIWRLNLQTQTRTELIQLSVFLAKAFPGAVLHNRRDPPVIALPGSTGGGKSMIVEAMMKALLDQTDPLDMLKPEAPRTIFIETYPTEALDSYCYAAGSHEGVPVLCGFDRINWNKKTLMTEFKKAAAAVRPKPEGGIIFSTPFLNSLDEKWLNIDVRYRNDRYSWKRDCFITVDNKKLKNDPKFRLHWNRLREIVKAGDLSALTLPVAQPLPPKTPPLNSTQLQLFERV